MTSSPPDTTPARQQPDGGSGTPVAGTVVIGVDIGGTKTHVRLADAHAVLNDVVVPTAHWRRHGAAAGGDDMRRLASLLREVSGDRGEVPAAVGANGRETAAALESFAAALRSEYRGRVTVVNDAALVVPAAGVEQGIALIAGTGSIVVGTRADGGPVVAGGHGWIFGDPGSGPGLVRESVRCVLRRRDDGLPPDALGTALLDHFELTDVTELIYRLADFPRIDEWSSAAPLVFTAASDGSPDAMAVIDDAARALAAQVAAVRRGGALGATVVCAGGVITHQPMLYAAVRTSLDRAWPGVDVRLLDRDPVDGAIALALAGD